MKVMQSSYHHMLFVLLMKFSGNIPSGMCNRAGSAVLRSKVMNTRSPVAHLFLGSIAKSIQAFSNSIYFNRCFHTWSVCLFVYLYVSLAHSLHPAKAIGLKIAVVVIISIPVQ